MFVTHKHAIINSLAYRLVNVPLNPVEYKKEYNCIIETAEKNGKPSIHDGVQKGIDSRINAFFVGTNKPPAKPVEVKA